MHERALEICEPSCVPRAGNPFFIHVVHSPPMAVGHVIAPELPSQGGGARSHGHVVAPELTSARMRGPGPRDTWQHQSSPRQGGEVRGRGTCGSTRARLAKEVRSRAAGHVVAPEPTSVGRCGPKLQLAWQRMDARPIPCLHLELVCGGTRSSGCRQRPPGPPWERLRTRRSGQFFGVPLGYLIFLLSSRRRTPGAAGAKGSEVGDVDGGPPGGAGGRFSNGHH
jgi:hypothetical protein